MKYNLKVSRYCGECQLSFYKDGITYRTEEEKKNVHDFSQILRPCDKPTPVTYLLAPSGKPIPNIIKKDVDTPFGIKCDEVIEFDELIFDEDNKRRSANRTKNTIYDYSRANKWEYFTTFTFSDMEYRYDYNICKSKLQKFLNNFKNRYCNDLKYLCVPEKHKDGAFHFHALISGNIHEYLAPGFNKGFKSWSKYNLGSSETEKVRDTNKVSMYITKYITKDMLIDIKGAQRFLVSKGLKKAEVSKHYLPEDIDIFEFIENHFPEYEISYSKKYDSPGMYGHDCNYIQLSLKKEE